MDTVEILAKAADLAEDIKNSAPQHDYMAALSRLKSDPDAVKKVAFFKKENIEYRTKVLQNITTSFDEEKYVSGLYTELMLIEVCRDFLAAEKKLLDLLAGALDKISSSCELEFGIFE